MLKVLHLLSTISVWIINFDDAKENRLDECLYSEWNLTASNFLLAAWLKWHGFRPVSFTMPYSKLYILTELSANEVKFISVDRQKLDLSKYIYLWYGKFYIYRDTARFYEHKNDPRIYTTNIRIL